MNTLEENEAIIHNHLKTAFDAGRALKEIKDNKQYEMKYGTGIGWESYLRKEFDISRQHAGELIAHFKVTSNIKSDAIASVLPETESQTRPLNNLPPDQQVEVWQEAVKKNPKPTAKDVKEIVKTIKLKDETEKPKKDFIDLAQDTIKVTKKIEGLFGRDDKLMLEILPLLASKDLIDYRVLKIFVTHLNLLIERIENIKKEFTTKTITLENSNGSRSTAYLS
jgi:hypothetical protein